MEQKVKKSKPTRKSLTAIDMYASFKKDNPDVSYLLYKEVLSRFNRKLSDAILLGYNFNPGFRLGRIRILKVKRKFKKPIIDWAESRKHQKLGLEKYLVYYTDPWWFRWYWEKKKCIVKNKSVYCFIPTCSNSRKDGNRNKLTKLLKSDPLAALRFQTR